MENVIAFLQSFNTQILSLNKNERQTFTFILENVIDYFRGMSQQDDEKSLRNLFVDFRFWIENLFKMFDQKVTGAIVANKKLALKNLFISGHPLQAELLYSSALVNFSLFPFMIQKGNQSLFLAGLDSRELVYVDPLSDEQMRAASSEGIKKLGEFCLANFAFGDWQLLDPQLREQDDPFLGKAEALALAFRHHEQRLFEESASVLNEAGFEDFNWPLLYLLQIKNLFNLGRMLEVKRLLQKFLIFYPYFAEGHELMGDVYQKEENLELALGFYEKALLINQNKGLSEKIKRLRETIEKNKNKPESQKSDLFYNISEAVLQSEERLIPRPKELRQMMEILISPSKRNVLLIGDRGVGKSALIRILAQKIIFEEVPGALREKKLKEINFVSLLTGSKYRGQFEEKVLKLLQEFRNQNAILVLEDIHLMVSSGAARGTALDLVNILKGFLRENSIQVIATTDYEEFKNTLEKDNSLLGYFQKLTLNEMAGEDTQKILKNLAQGAASREHLTVSPALLQSLVESAKRDIRERKLPDSAVLLFERCLAKVQLRSSGQAGQQAVGESDLAEVLADLLNLPESSVSVTLKSRLLSLKKNIGARIIGQDEALDCLNASLVASLLGYDVKKNRPNGVFLFIGPTGVGKTETGIAIGEALYGNQDYLIRIDMSEYMEKFTYSRFVGAAPGYVGYYDANQLTDKVRQNPFSIILLDEIEKADSQLLNIFLQVFDAGRMTDARGNVIDFSKTTIVMTSNIGTSLFSKASLGYQGNLEGSEVSRATLIKSLKRFFSPEFLNRIDEIVVFRHLEEGAVLRIIDVQLQQVRQDLEKQGKELVVKPEAIAWIARKGYSLEYGARHLSRTLKKELLEKIAPLSLEKEWEDARYVICSAAATGIDITLEPGPPELSQERLLAAASAHQKE